MKILNNNKLKEIKLKIENYNDLWVLSEILETKDIILKEIIYKIKIGNNDNYKIARKKIFIKLEIKEINLEDEILTIKGTIINETKYIPKGTLLNIKYKEGDIIEIIKQNLFSYQKKLLEDSINSKDSKNLLIGIDNDGVIVTEFERNNFKILYQQNGLGNKKLYSIKQENFIEKVFNEIKELLEKEYENIIIYGPAFWKNLLEETIKKRYNNEIKKKIFVIDWKDTSETSLHKVIEKIFREGILKENAIAIETQLINKLKERINKNTKFKYGFENVKEASFMNAIETLMISTKFLNKIKKQNTNNNNKFKELRDIIKNVELKKGKVHILNSKYEPGNILDGLGGIACLLRFDY